MDMDSLTRKPSFGSLAGARRRTKPRLLARDSIQPLGGPDSELVDLTQGSLSPRSIFRLGTMNSAPRAGDPSFNLGDDDHGSFSDAPLYGSALSDLPGCGSVNVSSQSRARRDILSDRDSNLLHQTDRPAPKLNIWKQTIADGFGPAHRTESAMEDAQPKIKEEPVERRIFETASSGPSLISKHLRNLDSMPTRPGAAPVVRLSRTPSSSSNNIGRFNPKRWRENRLPTPSIPSLSEASSSVTNDEAPADKKKQQSIKKASVAKMGRNVPVANMLKSTSTGVSSEQQGLQRVRGGSIPSALPHSPHNKHSNETALAKGSSPYHIYNSLPPTFVPNGDTDILDRAGLVLLTNEEKSPWVTRQPTIPGNHLLSTGESGEMDKVNSTDNNNTFIATSPKDNQMPSTGVVTAFQEADLNETNQSESAFSLTSQGDHPVQPLRNSIPTGEELSDVQNVGTLPFAQVNYGVIEVAKKSKRSQAQNSAALPSGFSRMISDVHGSDEPEASRSQPQSVDSLALTAHVNLDEVETASLSIPPTSPTDPGTSAGDRSMQNSNQARSFLKSRWANLPPDEIKRRERNNESSRKSRARQQAKDPEGYRQRKKAASMRHKEKMKGTQDAHQVKNEGRADAHQEKDEGRADAHQGKDERLEDIRQRVASIEKFITEVQSSGNMTDDLTQESPASGVDEPEIHDNIWKYYAQTAVEGPTEEFGHVEVYRSAKIGPRYSMEKISDAAVRKTRLLFHQYYKDLYGDVPRTKTLKEEKTMVPPSGLPIFTMRYDELKVVTTVSRIIEYQKSLPPDIGVHGSYIWLVKVRSEIFSTDIPGSSTTEKEYACTAPEIANERAANEFYWGFTDFIREWDDEFLKKRIDNIDDDVEQHLENIDDDGKLFDKRGVYDRTEGPMPTGSIDDSDDDDQSMEMDPQSSTAMLLSSTDLAPNPPSAQLGNEHAISADVAMLDAGEANEQEGNEVQSTNHADNNNHNDMSVGDESVEGRGVEEMGESLEEKVKGVGYVGDRVEDEGEDVEGVGGEEEEEDEDEEGAYNPSLKLKLHVYVVQLKLLGPKNY